MPDTAPRIGVTGARGVLGRRIADAFDRRSIVIESYRGDIRDGPALEAWIGGLTHLVHAAALVPVGAVADDPAAAIAVNVGGTAAAAKACAAAGTRMIYISTSHVYRPSAEDLREDDPIQPASLYGLTKYQGEQWVGALCPDASILRLFSYFDERQADTYLVPSLLKRILAAPPHARLPLVGATSIRDIADAWWLGEACVALTLDAASATYNVSAGCAKRVIDLAREVAAAAGRTDIVWQAEAGIGNTLAADRSRLIASTPDLPPFDLETAIDRFVTARGAASTDRSA